tara:strand:+ start:332 stop:574 length:243 start_codon:yes stop_codon:yes gene_type:complete
MSNKFIEKIHEEAVDSNGYFIGYPRSLESNVVLTTPFEKLLGFTKQEINYRWSKHHQYVMKKMNAKTLQDIEGKEDESIN